MNWSAKIAKKYKLAGHGYCLLLEREVRIVPLEEVAINLTPVTGDIIFKVAKLL